MQKEAGELRQTRLNDQQNICIFKFFLAYDVVNSQAILSIRWDLNK